MGDWNQDPLVIAAIREFDAARARWSQIAPADGILRTCATTEQQIAFARMQSADSAYVWARDIAIHRGRSVFEDVDSGSNWLEQSREAWPLRSTAADGEPSGNGATDAS